MKRFIWALLCISLSSADRQHLNQVLLSKCSGNTVGPRCIKLELLRLFTLLKGATTRIPLGQGVSLTGSVGGDQTLDTFSRDPKSNQLDDLLYNKSQSYLNSLNFTLDLGPAQVSARARSLAVSLGRNAGRRSTWVAIGTVLAVAFALLAALSGKALMAALLALLMSALLTIKAGGLVHPGHMAFPAAAGRITAYEVYHPVDPSYIDHEHHHSSALTAAVARRSPGDPTPYTTIRPI